MSSESSGGDFVSVDGSDGSVSSVTDTHHTGRDDLQSTTASVASSETRRVKRAKWIVTACLATAAVVLGLATFRVTRNEERDDCESQVGRKRRQRSLLDAYEGALISHRILSCFVPSVRRKIVVYIVCCESLSCPTVILFHFSFVVMPSKSLTFCTMKLTMRLVPSGVWPPPSLPSPMRHPWPGLVS